MYKTQVNGIQFHYKSDDDTNRTHIVLADPDSHYTVNIILMLDHDIIASF